MKTADVVSFGLCGLNTCIHDNSIHPTDSGRYSNLRVQRTDDDNTLQWGKHEDYNYSSSLQHEIYKNKRKEKPKKPKPSTHLVAVHMSQHNFISLFFLSWYTVIKHSYPFSSIISENKIE